MTARPPAASNPYGLAVWERIGLGLIGLAAAVGMLWVTWVAAFLLALMSDTECSSRGPSWLELVLMLGIGALISGVVGLCWLSIASVITFAVRRRGIRGRAWLAVPAAFVALAGIFCGLIVVNAPAGPPAPGACAPIYE